MRQRRSRRAPRARPCPAVATNVLTFTKATGLTFAGEGWTITGSDALYTAVGLKPVYI